MRPIHCKCLAPLTENDFLRCCLDDNGAGDVRLVLKKQNVVPVGLNKQVEHPLQVLLRRVSSDHPPHVVADQL